MRKPAASVEWWREVPARGRALSSEEFVGEIKPKRKPSPARAAKACAEAVAIVTATWNEGGFDPEALPIERYLVGLHAVLHELVHKAECRDLAVQFFAACSAAKSFVAKEFEGDSGRALAYVRWCWRAEKRKEEWARANNVARKPVTWRAVFVGRQLLDEYRVEAARAAARREA